MKRVSFKCDWLAPAQDSFPFNVEPLCILSGGKPPFPTCELPALITVWIILTAFATLISQSSLIMVPLIAVTAFLAIFAMRRYGLLALTTAGVVAHLLIFFPVTTELTAWYATDFTITLAITLALAVYAAYTSVGGSKVFSGKMFAD